MLRSRFVPALLLPCCLLSMPGCGSEEAGTSSSPLATSPSQAPAGGNPAPGVEPSAGPALPASTTGDATPSPGTDPSDVAPTGPAVANPSAPPANTPPTSGDAGAGNPGMPQEPTPPANAGGAPATAPGAGSPVGVAGAAQVPDPGLGGAAAQGPDPSVDTEALVGWAATPGLGLETTSGGAGGPTLTVTTAQDLLTAAAAAGPMTIEVSGVLDTGTLVVTSNKTLIGLAGATIIGDIHMNGVQNIILRNLTIRGLNCSDDPTCDGGGEDAIVANDTHHLWFDHLDVSDGSDGNLDLASGSDFITVSWSRFSYSEPGRGHRFSNLVGSSDDNPVDEGHLNVTFHHNWWAENVVERMPRTRYGQVHVFNNLYTAVGNNLCVLAGFQASVLLEGNVFAGVSAPHRLGGGNLLARDNLYTGVSGSQEDTGIGFLPPYAYALEPSASVAATVMANAGPR